MSSSASVVAEGKRSKRSAQVRATEPTETHTTLFEWPLTNLKHHFDSSKSDTKSTVIKSAPFGGGRWTVLFYAQSGHEQYCSLYLNAEPLPSEKAHTLLLSSPGVSSSGSSRDLPPSKSKRDGSEEKWSREGLFRFTFQIMTLDRLVSLGTKEAHDHAFSQKTSNWGWAQFAKRDVVYYGNSAVKQTDAFLISVSITASPQTPEVQRPIGHTVPPLLVQAMGSLLDDPDHSDIVFYLDSQRRSADSRRRSPVRKIYAIKKILAARSEYFKDMFEGGFLEGGHADSTDDENESFVPISASPVQNVSRSAASRSGADPTAAGQDSTDADDDFYYDYQNEALLEDSDEELEGPMARGPNPDANHGSLAHRDRAGAQSNVAAASDNDEDVDDDEFAEEDEVVAVSGPGATVNNSRHTSLVFEDAGTGLSPEDDGASGGPVTEGNAADVDDGELGSRKSKFASSESVVASTNLASSTVRLAAAGNSEVGTPEPVAFKKEDASDLEANTTGQHEATPSHMYKRKQKRGRGRICDAPGRDGSSRGTRKKRRKVIVRDSAYPTFKALLYFLYTDTIEFAPLTSSFLPSDLTSDDIGPGGAAGGYGVGEFGGGGSSLSDGPRFRTLSSGTESFNEEMRKAHARRKSVIEMYCAQHPDKPSPCSAKAMYRLADKLQIADLKKRAQDHIANSLTVHNIVWEVFSGFNTQFPDIRKMETDFLLKHWPSVKKSRAMKTIFYRYTAHPGLADVWPYLLSQLEYRPASNDDTGEGSDSD
ncbi:hypothetical protein IE53DRAFT_391045 [Violaceomyces palustris]|uniref:Uncharacterized protein n=1 Tax=Violaceomyces palustris TaxID=1673888 RepID=A0ACD0NLV9_9BASI|nr:hypothetical protein IE53DRAFT_391045 [Violaceomyces palustris]